MSAQHVQFPQPHQRVGRARRQRYVDHQPLPIALGVTDPLGGSWFVEQLTEKIPFYDVRHSVKPGVTGWAQVRYPYGASIEDGLKKLEYDLYYVKNHSLFLDLMIMVETIQVVLLGKGAR